MLRAFKQRRGDNVFVIDHKTYSGGFLKEAISLACKNGLADSDPDAGKRSTVRNGISVQTPIGEMTAFSSYEDDEFPGLGIDIKPGDHVIGLVTCEVDGTKDNELHTIVFADADDENYSDIIIHYGEELGEKP